MPAEVTQNSGWRRWGWWFAPAALLCIGIYFLKPVVGPARDLTLVGDPGRGNYLIVLSGCASCHTEHHWGMEGARLAGGDALKTVFGTFYPPNITPDGATGIGDWSLAQFSDAISNGEGSHGNLYPVFPYNDLTLMSDQDVADLYAALVTTPPVSHRALQDDVSFPFNIRPLVSVWKNLFFSPRRYQPNTARSERWNRGNSIANGLAHCVACHSPSNPLGATERGHEYAGNPAGGPGGKAPALTAAALVQDGYDVAGMATTLKTGITPDAGRVGREMALVIDDETSRWTDGDREAVAAYLLNIN